MKLIISLMAAAVLTGCAGQGSFTKPVDFSKSRTIFVEPIEGDLFGNESKLAFFLNSHGFDTVNVKESAEFRMRADFTYTGLKLSGYAKITELKTGDTVYSGNCSNGGFGTLVSPGNAIWNCLERALSGIK